MIIGKKTTNISKQRVNCKKKGKRNRSYKSEKGKKQGLDDKLERSTTLNHFFFCFQCTLLKPSSKITTF